MKKVFLVLFVLSISSAVQAGEFFYDDDYALASSGTHCVELTDLFFAHDSSIGYVDVLVRAPYSGKRFHFVQEMCWPWDKTSHKRVFRVLKDIGIGGKVCLKQVRTWNPFCNPFRNSLDIKIIR